MGEYEIIPYNSDFEAGVAKVMTFLWGTNQQDSVNYLRWKYYNNPYTEKPLGVVALYKNQVVGFRGYFAAPWQTHNGTQIAGLASGDTVVDEKHRRKGLSIAMGYKAAEEYESEYKFFLNFSSTMKSLPGYLRLGFVPLADRDEWQRWPNNRNKKIENQFDNVEVLKNPKPQEMAHLASKELSNKITMLQDENFFSWRFKNNKNNYKFYYHKEGYIILGASEGSPHFEILDYTENTFEPILKWIIKSKTVEGIKIVNIGLSKRVFETIKNLEFKTNNPRKKTTCPLLVRPTGKYLKEEDWFIENVDMRNIENWKLKWIYSEWG